MWDRLVCAKDYEMVVYSCSFQCEILFSNPSAQCYSCIFEEVYCTYTHKKKKNGRVEQVKRAFPSPTIIKVKTIVMHSLALLRFELMFFNYLHA